jgi:hypothetical protein
VSDYTPRTETLTDGRGALFSTAIAALQVALGDNVVGVIVTEADGKIAIIPRPGAGVALVQALAQTDWQRTLRIAEEFAE